MISRLAEKSLDAHIEREATITVDAPAGALGGILLTGEIKPIVEGLKDGRLSTSTWASAGS